MEAVFYRETKNIYRLRIPFEDLYTSVFLIKSGNEAALVDCATTSDDVDGYIVPALAELGYVMSDICALVLTHRHGDHAGGLSRVLSLAPNIKVITSVCELGEGVCIYPMAGHTEDFIGVLDMGTNTLISGDGLQGAGIGKYRNNIKDTDAYIKTVERIKNDERIENILFSHAFEPWKRDSVWGRENVLSCLDDCLKYVKGEEKL